MTVDTIETERLLLRPIRADDFEDWARCFADPAVNRHLLGKPMERWEAWRNMATVIGHWSLRGYGFFSVAEKATGRWVGRVGPWFPEGWPGQEVGWTIAPWAQRKGYAAESGLACVRYAFEHLGWPEVIHIIRPGNEGSIRTAERIGSRLLRSVDDLMGLGPVLVYGQRQTTGA